MKAQEIIDSVKSKKLIAVITINDAKNAVPLAKALYNGGISAIELTLRTDAALESIRRIRAEVPEMVVAAGTVLTPKQIDEVVKAGAHWAVAPGTNPRVLQAAQDAGLFFAPGIMTPSDIEAALEFGCRLLKFFPAGTTGGMKHLKAMSAPYNHLGLSYIPLGGVNTTNLADFVSDPLIAAVGGSWLAKPDQIKNGEFDKIQAQAEEAAKIIASVNK